MKKKGSKSAPKSIGRKAANDTKNTEDHGVEVKDEDIELAFEFFGQKDGNITPSSLRSVFLALNKKLTTKELKTIFDGKNSMSIQEVKFFLKDYTIEMDPVVEAFSILDPTHSGFLSDERLNKIFSNLGYGDLTEEELAALVQTVDSDGDGRLGFDDFRMLACPEGAASSPGGA